MKRKGFTLIELLIVLLVLAAIFTAGLNNIWNPFWKIFHHPTLTRDPLALATGLIF